MFIPLSRAIIIIIHNYVVAKLIAVNGVNYEGMIQGSIDRAHTKIHGKEMFPDVRDKAGSILYSLIRFHVFTDGCKRTGLLAAYLLLMYNGYILEIPEDSAKFLESIADLENPESPREKDVIEWIKKHSKKSRLCRFLNWAISIGIKLGLDLGEYTRTILRQGLLPTFTPEKFKDTSLEQTLKKREYP